MSVSSCFSRQNELIPIFVPAWFWVETHGPDFPFALPENARWIGARVDGRIAGQVDYDPARSQYRLRFPGDVGSRPVLVELEYQGSGQDAASKWWAPRLLDGGVVLQSLWELRVPWSLAVVGVPHGWSDENQWYWTGYVWKRRPWKNVASLSEWILGAGVSPSSINDFSGSSPDDSDRYLFSRSGQPVAFSVWIVPRSWLVAVCSGATLFVGFFAIFTKIRFRTIWLGIAVLGLLAAVLVQPGVTFLAIQSALIGVVLTIVGLVRRFILKPGVRVTLDQGRRGGSAASGFQLVVCTVTHIEDMDGVIPDGEYDSMLVLFLPAVQ